MVTGSSLRIRIRELVNNHLLAPICMAHPCDHEQPYYQSGVTDGVNMPLRPTDACGRSIVTLVVKLRTLIPKLIRSLPEASEKHVLQTNGLLEMVAGLSALLGYKILPNFTTFCQKRAANGLEQGLKRGFFSTDFIKWRKVRASCQFVNRRSAWLFQEAKNGTTKEGKGPHCQAGNITPIWGCTHTGSVQN